MFFPDVLPEETTCSDAFRSTLNKHYKPVGRSGDKVQCILGYPNTFSHGRLEIRRFVRISEIHLCRPFSLRIFQDFATVVNRLLL